MAFAMRSICDETKGSCAVIVASPWRSALRLAHALPRAVLGPVLFAALLRLALALAADVIFLPREWPS
jgi:hypothetical protein